MFLAQFGNAFKTSSEGYVFMWIIALFGAVALAIIIERFYFILVRSNVNADKFMAEIRKLVAGGNIERAIELCEKGKQKALPFVVLRGLKRANESEQLDFRAIQNAVDEGTLEVIPKLKERTSYLAMLANVATLTGLMGTIYGLIISFAAVGSDAVSEEDKSRLLAQGIAAAMNTTIFGLMVAIPTLMAYTYISNRTNKIIDELDEHLVKLINLITGNR
ncbi:MotA/TolQ/ExbB proton channel [Caldithrix abyssi DSM 13497]|uniref:Biopolymer transport protein ExbB/TolQ n=1 Tax=Caldithrix abyssi DSM 13497 TaxID=880073 RepID=H1XNT5_CALAY|nr:MotA/TolQ/ExbB proton channel family protein [Caldithrix abyssi]APF19770.1 Biopolymer transport protein ExbB/TolQ [Caldithrix abyssi DSM 13497]EHO39875.1 MotA/TolQ/ExbB proton channel [Caldithrix abyssi DSM 13497]